eukprot:8949218-Pyramimonas_sp.AAC.1
MELPLVAWRGAATLAPSPPLQARAARPAAAGWPMPSHTYLLLAAWRGAATLAPSPSLQARAARPAAV